MNAGYGADNSISQSKRRDLKQILALLISGKVNAASRADDSGHGGTQTGPAAAELKLAAQRAELCSASNIAGVGLQGEYFSDALGREKPLLTRIDGPIDFAAGLEWPEELKGRRPRMVRWSGWVKPVVTGKYRFHADAGGATVSVSRQPMSGAGAADGVSIEMAAGRFYPLTMVYPVSAMNGNRIRLEWTAPYGMRFLIPRSLLYMPTTSLTTR